MASMIAEELTTGIFGEGRAETATFGNLCYSVFLTAADEGF